MASRAGVAHSARRAHPGGARGRRDASEGAAAAGVGEARRLDWRWGGGGGLFTWSFRLLIAPCRHVRVVLGAPRASPLLREARRRAAHLAPQPHAHSAVSRSGRLLGPWSRYYVGARRDIGTGTCAGDRTWAPRRLAAPTHPRCIAACCLRAPAAAPTRALVEAAQHHAGDVRGRGEGHGAGVVWRRRRVCVWWTRGGGCKLGAPVHECRVVQRRLRVRRRALLQLLLAHLAAHVVAR